MHELSICQNILRQVEETVTQHQASGVRTIHVQLGLLSGITPQQLQRAFTVASLDTVAEGAELIAELSSIQLQCRVCNRKGDSKAEELLCQHCGSADIKILSGDEIVLLKIALIE